MEEKPYAAGLPSQWTAEALVDRYGDDLLRLCVLYLGDRQLAEDAFQETMVKAWKALNGYRGESSMKTWLSSIAVNTCRDMLRSGWLRMHRKSKPFETLLDYPAEEREETHGVVQAVLGLQGKYREVVVLYYLEGMKLREIAEALHLSIHSVSTRLRRARILLRRELTADGEESYAGK